MRLLYEQMQQDGKNSGLSLAVLSSSYSGGIGKYFLGLKTLYVLLLASVDEFVIE